MLMLLFSVGQNLYAIDTEDMVEVIPRVLLRKVTHAPEYIAGLLNYRGMIAPVIDLSQLIDHQPCRPILSTRIMMVKYSLRGGDQGYLGLMAEQVTETLKVSENELKPSGLHTPSANYLGNIIINERGMIQQIQISALFQDYNQQQWITNSLPEGGQ